MSYLNQNYLERRFASPMQQCQCKPPKSSPVAAFLALGALGGVFTACLLGSRNNSPPPNLNSNLGSSIFDPNCGC